MLGWMWDEARHSRLPFFVVVVEMKQMNGNWRRTACVWSAVGHPPLLPTMWYALCVAFAFCYVSCHMFIFICMVCVCVEQAQRACCSSFFAEQAINKIPRRILSSFFRFHLFVGISVSCSAWNMRTKSEKNTHTHTRREQASCTHYHSLTRPNAQSKRNLLQLIFISPEICKRNEFFMVGKFGIGGVAGARHKPSDFRHAKQQIRCNFILFVNREAFHWISCSVLSAFLGFLMISDGIRLKSAVEWRARASMLQMLSKWLWFMICLAELNVSMNWSTVPSCACARIGGSESGTGEMRENRKSSP